jgi:hypothetical protein
MSFYLYLDSFYFYLIYLNVDQYHLHHIHHSNFSLTIFLIISSNYGQFAFQEQLLIIKCPFININKINKEIYLIMHKYYLI